MHFCRKNTSVHLRVSYDDVSLIFSVFCWKCGYPFRHRGEMEDIGEFDKMIKISEKVDKSNSAT